MNREDFEKIFPVPEKMKWYENENQYWWKYEDDIENAPITHLTISEDDINEARIYIARWETWRFAVSTKDERVLELEEMLFVARDILTDNEPSIPRTDVAIDKTPSIATSGLRKIFEKEFPVPKGVEWDENSARYKPNYSSFAYAASVHNKMLQAWEVATSQNNDQTNSVVLRMRDAQMLLLNVREQLREETMWINKNRLASSIQALNRAIVKAESIDASQEQKITQLQWDSSPAGTTHGFVLSSGRVVWHKYDDTGSYCWFMGRWLGNDLTVEERRNDPRMIAKPPASQEQISACGRTSNAN